MADEEERLRRLRDQKEKEQKEKIQIEKDKKERAVDQENKKKVAYTQYQDNSKFVDYVIKEPKQKKNEFTDELSYNQGDKDLEPYFNPRARNAKSKIPPPDKTKLEKLGRMNILKVAGVRLFSAMMASDWTLREAAILAFKDFLKDPLLPRYFNKTINLFNCAIELSKMGVEDKVNQIYIESIQIIETCLSPPICGNDIPPTQIQKQIKYFIPIIIKKISELNMRQRDLSLKTLISIFKHPALNIGDLVKGCMDIVERNDGVTPDKQPHYSLLARLEIIMIILEEYGIDDNLWDWYPVFNELIIPSFFHSNPDCKLVSQQICVLMYQIIGEDIKIMVEDPSKNIKPQIKNQLMNRFREIDLSNKQLNSTSFKGISSSELGEINVKDSSSNVRQELDPIIEAHNDNESSFSGNIKSKNKFK